jgi:hypothetical protein
LGWKLAKNQRETLRFSLILEPKYWILSIPIVLNNIGHGTLGVEELAQIIPRNNTAEIHKL